MSNNLRPYRGGRVEAAPPPDDVDRSKCVAYGCPLRGSVDLGGGGRFTCSAHAWVDAEKWPQVTTELREHDWLIGLMSDLRRPDMHAKAWRNYADRFWREADPTMVPEAAECRDLYLQRLHLELMHRVGARVKRPTVLVPQGKGWVKRPGGMAAALPQVAVEEPA